MKYFVSYTTRDKEVTVSLLEQVFKKLTPSGTVFIDILHNDSPNKQERVFQELDNSDLLVLIETENVYKSKWVQLEINRANASKTPIHIFQLKDLESDCFSN